MIKAECHSDDYAVKVIFDATKWFEQASEKEINSLRDCDWGGDYPADEVAMFMAEHCNPLKEVFKYIELRYPIEHLGFECNVTEEEAEEWVNANK